MVSPEQSNIDPDLAVAVPKYPIPTIVDLTYFLERADQIVAAHPELAGDYPLVNQKTDSSK